MKLASGVSALQEGTSRENVKPGSYHSEVHEPVVPPASAIPLAPAVVPESSERVRGRSCRSMRAPTVAGAVVGDGGAAVATGAAVAVGDLDDEAAEDAGRGGSAGERADTDAPGGDEEGVSDGAAAPPQEAAMSAMRRRARRKVIGGERCRTGRRYDGRTSGYDDRRSGIDAQRACPTAAIRANVCPR